ncbi:MAG: molybdopterin converting factor subunit 1 [Proteobacteria bacterium]|jgi:sulfur-carrier protein|nr:molybdopterin converting factor subunit 1 [Pseudomonadota bacterium]MCG6936033.1 molybdopterin converting factor subunit 1 [Pseudomonadota bacterium]
MSITVKYFASLREQMGTGEVRLDTSAATTVGEAWQQATDGADLPANLLMAVNMEYVDAHHKVQDGDEVAFFPPVTGG